MGRIPENYMEKLYAGLLGKTIGVRLGAPIEGWSY
ncbi:MAG: ADP-ribosylglycohydrolase family protein, partial [Clostridiales bacterium]|nr:ADP-ribosylglycohydrolase family protein [Clostridiales bacterium]